MWIEAFYSSLIAAVVMRPAGEYSGIFGVGAGPIALHFGIAAERKPVKEVAAPLPAVGTTAGFRVRASQVG
jgi:hypothetical protein